MKKRKTSSKSRSPRPSPARYKPAARVAIVMGRNSDLPTMKSAAEALKRFGIAHDIRVISAHRTPVEVGEFAESAARRGYRVIIAGAGGAAHLPGMIAAHSVLPVIGVPVPIGHMQGQDALLSIVQMPKGIPVATMAIGNAWNAGVLAAQILAAGGLADNPQLLRKITEYKEEMRFQVLSKSLS